jgi:putative acetyltransferase
MPDSNLITLKRTNSLDADFAPLINLLDADLAFRYGDLQLSYNAFNVIPYIDTVVIAFYNNEAVGCACFKGFDDTSVEIKRMFVKPDIRGKGVASLILRELEDWAKQLGYIYTVLETGDKQHEAIALYNKLGYELTENYEPYINMDSSICMRKVL